MGSINGFLECPLGLIEKDFIATKMQCKGYNKARFITYLYFWVVKDIEEFIGVSDSLRNYELFE